MKIVFEPEQRYLLQIGNWLREEAQQGKSNFYGNFTYMKFTSDNFVCFVNTLDEAIGFMKYSIDDKYAHIDLTVVRYEQQRKGIGKMLLDAVTEKVRQQGTVALSLMCAPKSSSKKWKKLGFKKFKEVDNHDILSEKQDEQPWLYKIIVQAKKTTRKKELDSYISLWTQLEYIVYSSKMAPTYRWDVTTLDSPIVYPVDGEWKIKYVKQGHVVYEGVLKRFRENSCTSCAFLVIEKLS